MSTASSYEIALLADRPEAIPTIAAGYEAEWDFWYGSGGKGNAKTDLVARSNAQAMPIGFVALEDGIAVGAVALVANAIAPRPELSPCLVGLWVAPEHRRRGVATALLAASVAKAAALKYRVAYVATTNAQALFERTGWTEIERTKFRGEEFWIYAIACPRSLA